MKKKQGDNLRGHLLENRIYKCVEKILGCNEQDNYKNVVIPRHPSLKNKPFCEKASVEVDNMFVYRGVLYIVECKLRRARDDHFWMPDEKSSDIWFNKKRATGRFIGQLWMIQKYIKKHNKFYICQRKPRIQTILLVDSVLKVGKCKAHYGYVRDTYVITNHYFTEFLQELKSSNKKWHTPYNIELKSSTGNQGGGV